MIEVGDKVPAATMLVMQNGKPEQVALQPMLAGRKVAIFGVPGPFTGTCSAVHVPSFIAAAAELREKGVDEVICLAGSDPWVMEAWGEATGGTAAGIRFLGEPSGALAEAMGLKLDAPAVGFFNRFRRFSMLAEDGVVKVLNLEEEKGVCVLTSGSALVEAL